MIPTHDILTVGGTIVSPAITAFVTWRIARCSIATKRDDDREARLAKREKDLAASGS